MRCAIISRSGQTLARGNLLIQTDEAGALRLDLKTDGGRHLKGGTIGPNGDMTVASQILFRQFFQVWGMSDLKLTVTVK